jgi:AhpD family alkylhydroperoxidase
MDILCDAQTSGGLLLSVAWEKAEQAVGMLRASGCAEAAVVGRMREKPTGGILVTAKGRNDQAARRNAGSGRDSEDAAPVTDTAPRPASAPSGEEACCAPESAPATAGGASAAFGQFMAAALAPGRLDVIQKELMTIALSVATRCEQCLRLHLDKARRMGISREEIEEAALMGVAFGGCSSMMFWREVSKSAGTNGGA